MISLAMLWNCLWTYLPYLYDWLLSSCEKKKSGKTTVEAMDGADDKDDKRDDGSNVFSIV
jgi:hypothetical protein